MALQSTATAKVTITPLEGGGGKAPCKAQFNPKELQVDKTVSWTPKDAHKEDPTMEYKEPQSRQLQCTLYFDTFEQAGDCHGLIEPLEKMAEIDAGLKHPPLCQFQWGSFTFVGVVSSLSQKYTMFGTDGKRLRAEVALTMQSASSATVSAGGK